MIAGKERSHDLSYSTVEAYNLGTQVVEELPPLRVARHYHCSTALKGYLYVFGGRDSVGNDLSQIEYLPVEQALRSKNQQSNLCWQIFDHGNDDIEGRRFALMLPINSHQLVIFGGLDSSGPCETQILLLDTQQRTLESHTDITWTEESKGWCMSELH